MPSHDPFHYHAPNADTAPRFKVIADVWEKCHHTAINTMEKVRGSMEVTPEHYAAVNAASKEFFDVIQRVCPPSADRSAAEQCVRLARMKVNESMVRSSKEHFQSNFTIKIGEAALMDLLSAKHQANAAIALALPNELPAWEGQ